jgi:hypothetical protein
MLKTALALTTLALLPALAKAGTAPPKAPSAALTTVAEATDLGFEFILGYDTEYNFRGQAYGENITYLDLGYEFSITDKLSLEIGGWYAVVPDAPDAFTEMDYYATLSYVMSENTTVGLSYTHYSYFNIDWADQLELGTFVETSWGSFDFAFAFYHDFQVDGQYVQAAVSRTFEVSDWLAIEPGALISANRTYLISDTGFNNVGLSLAFPIPVTDNLVLRPYIAAALPVDALKDAGFDDSVYGGVSLTLNF